MRGRKPVPTLMKLIAGNPGKRALNKDEPKPMATAPVCPPELSPAAQQEWKRLVGELAGLNMLTNLDRVALATYCEAYAIWIEAISAVRKYGAMVKSPSGYPIQSPYLAIANKQAEIMMRVASEFGLTPASRSRITVPGEPEPTLFDLIKNSGD